MDNSFKILLIEDDKEDYLIIKQLISEVRSTKFTLDWVATFDEGLAAIRRNAHDVYLLDYRLGGKDGLELARDAFTSGHKPVLIMLTGHDDQGLDIRAMQAGAADFLVKSMLRRDILERSIRYAIERKNTQRALEAEIDKRKKIEEALRLDEMRLEALWELSKMSQASDETIVQFILGQQMKITGSLLGCLRLAGGDETSLTFQSATEAYVGGSYIEWFPHDKEEFWSNAGQTPFVMNGFEYFGNARTADGALSRAMYVPILDSGRVAAAVLLAGKKSNYDESNIRQVSLLLEGMWWFVQRQRANNALRDAERSLRIMADSLPVLISYIDSSLRYRFVNRAYEHLYRVAAEKIVGLEVRQLLSPQIWEIVRHHVQEGLQGKEVQYEVEGRFPAGERFLSVYVIPDINGSGEVTGIFALIHDLTERKRDELQAQRLRDELAHITRVASMGEISSSLAHELGQPLTGIMSNTQAARRFLEREEPELEEVKLALDDIVDDCRRAGNVIKRLRSILKKKAFEKTPIDINDLVEETVKLLANNAMRNHVTVETELSPGLPLLSGDRIQLQQVLINLMLNGFDAMANLDRDSRRMILRTASAGDTIIVEVIDFGEGIDPDQLSRIFDPFVTTKEEGMGMGLPISRHILEGHSGQIWAKRNSECGMTFTFSLPVEEN